MQALKNATIKSFFPLPIKLVDVPFSKVLKKKIHWKKRCEPNFSIITFANLA